jgi:AcrR family transcriptional regulator
MNRFTSALAPAEGATIEQVTPALTSKGKPRKRLTREQRAVDARAQIFAAAAEVVGKHGYTDASIGRITEAAGIAQGTFYLYFESRQALFDELLPHVGEDMFQFIGKRVVGARDVYELEERGLRAFFEYLENNPGFFRILNEAEVAAPKAHQRHFKQTADHFVASLQRSHRSGQIKEFDHDDLETVVYVFMAARSYLYLRYVKGRESGARIPEKVISAYMRLVRGGLR